MTTASNKQQRISYQLIHTLVANVNSGMNELREVTSSLQERNILEGKGSVTEQDGDRWGKKVICEFNNVASTIWHIKYHLANPKNPDLSPYKETHEKYLQYLESVEIKVADIIEQAKNLDRDKFEKVYDPEAFSKDIL